MERYLYRGVNKNIYNACAGKLIPKDTGTPFTRFVHYGEEVYYDGGATYDTSETNAVIMHQIDSSKYPSSGISTTPLLVNAKKYATNKGKYDSGYVYKIDTHLFEVASVKAYPVDDHAVQPAIPGDKEVILVAKEFGVLPDEIIVEILNV